VEFHAEVEIDIDRPAPEVFDFLADAHNMPRWSAEFQEMTKLTDGPPAKGTQWRFRLRQEPKMTDRWKNAIMRRETPDPPPVEGMVEWVEFEHPRVVAWQGPRIHRGPGAIHITPRGRFLIEDRGNGSHVRYILQPTLDGMPKPAVPVFNRLLKRGRGRDLETLKALLEAREDQQAAAPQATA
jgi:hypothetical protein